MENKKKYIIVIDDDQNELKEITQILSEEFSGYRIDRYKDPRAFYKKQYAKYDYDEVLIIITDIYMLGGYSNVKQLTKQLKKKPSPLMSFLGSTNKLRDVPIIGYSKFVDKFDQVVAENPQKGGDISEERYVIEEKIKTLNFLKKYKIPLVYKYDDKAIDEIISLIKKEIENQNNKKESKHV